MNVKSKLKFLFKSIFTQFGSLVSDEGQMFIWDEDGELAEGYAVYMEQEDENGELTYVPVPDGEYKNGNRTIVVAEGKVAEIREEEAPAEPEEPAAEPMAEETPAEEAPAEEPAAEEPAEPEFDAEQAIAEVNNRIDELFGEIQDLKNQLAQILEQPAEEDAFEAAKKNEAETEKKFICKAAHK